MSAETGRTTRGFTFENRSGMATGFALTGVNEQGQAVIIKILDREKALHNLARLIAEGKAKGIRERYTGMMITPIMLDVCMVR